MTIILVLALAGGGVVYHRISVQREAEAAELAARKEAEAKAARVSAVSAPASARRPPTARGAFLAAGLAALVIAAAAPAYSTWTAPGVFAAHQAALPAPSVEAVHVRSTLFK